MIRSNLRFVSKRRFSEVVGWGKAKGMSEIEKEPSKCGEDSFFISDVCILILRTNEINFHIYNTITNNNRIKSQLTLELLMVLVDGGTLELTQVR